MTKSVNFTRSILFLSLPILIIISVVVLSQSSIFFSNPGSLSTGITVDLLLTLPLVYFLVIRKRNIPKTTIVPVFILGLIIASSILPSNQQHFLDGVKYWFLPILEISVFTFVFIKVRKAVKTFTVNKSSSFDFYTVLKQTTAEIAPPKIAKAIAMEIAVFYYCFFKWKAAPVPPNGFTYHKDTGTRAVALTLIFLILIETFSFHLLLVENYPVVAWVLTGLSIYSGFQILGFMKSLNQRPTYIKNGMLHLRYGILAEADLDISTIDSIELNSRPIEKEDGITFLSLAGELEGQNLIVHFKKEQSLNGLYGLKKRFTKLALHIDDKDRFYQTLKDQIEPK